MAQVSEYKLNKMENTNNNRKKSVHSISGNKINQNNKQSNDGHTTTRDCIRTFTLLLISIALLTSLILTVVVCAENQRIGKDAPVSTWWYNYVSPMVRLVYDSSSSTSSSNRRGSFGYLYGRDSDMIKTTRDKQEASIVKSSCLVNRFDRLIDQKWNTSDISKPIYRDGQFNNPWDTWQPPTVTEAIKILLTEPDESQIPAPREELDENLPIVRPELESPPNGGQYRVTWLGHSTLLIQVDGYNILTDPIFSKRASPIQYMGPVRFREPPITIGELPRIDIVVISHNHYDHLDAISVDALNKRFGKNCRWLVPRGLAEFMQSSSIANYQELDWWHKDCFPVNLSLASNESTYEGDPFEEAIETIPNITTQLGNSSQRSDDKRQLQIYMTPAQHWSRRSLNDIYKSLWGSYTFVSSSSQKFFFTGDTGYCPVFKEISKIFGPMNGAAIPIGAYKPRWFAKAIHVDPKDAIRIHRDLKSFKSMAIHWGTFVLSSEHYMEPARLLYELMDNATDLNGSPFIAINHGASLTFCSSKGEC